MSTALDRRLISPHSRLLIAAPGMAPARAYHAAQLRASGERRRAGYPTVNLVAVARDWRLHAPHGWQRIPS